MEIKDEVYSKLISEYGDLNTSAVNHRLSGREIVYHYCSIETLYYIIEKNCLRATHTLYLNDTKEFKLAFEVLENIINDLERDYTHQIVLEALESFKNKITERSRDSKYVCCFSLAKDLLSQWRAYGANGHGCSIGFHLNKMTYEQTYGNYSDAKVIYGVEKQRRRLRLLALQYIKSYWERKIDPHSVTMMMKDIISEDVAWEAISYKDKSFQEEREVRLFTDERRLAAEDRIQDSRLEVKYRPARDLIVPYVEVYNTSRKLPIREIVLGPCTNFNMIKGGLEGFLNKNGYGSVKIKKSKIPYRS